MARSKWKWIVSLVLLVGIAVLWWLRSHGPPKAFVIELEVVDSDTAAVMWRANYEDGSRGWVGVVDASGHTKWWRELPDMPLGGDALRVGNGTVAVRYSHDGKDQALVAFSLEDGTRLWDRVLSPYHPRIYEGGRRSSPELGLYFAGSHVGDHLVEWVDAGNESFFVGVDPESGRELWRRSTPSDIWSNTWIAGSHLIQHNVSKVQTIDVTDGAHMQFDTAGSGCVVDDEYLTIMSWKKQHALVAFSQGNTARRVIAQQFLPGEEGSHVFLRSCGRYRDRLVFSLDLTRYDPEHAARSWVIVADRTGQILHRIELPYDQHWDSFDRQHPQSAPLAGELTRFVPYLQVSAGGDDVQRLIMLDLEQGIVAWAGPQDRRVIHTALFRAGSTWYWVENSVGALVSAFDGDTGQLRSAILARNRRGVGRVEPTHVRNGQFWMHSSEWTPLDEPSIFVFDANTLFPLFESSIEVQGATAEIRKYLESR